MKHSSDQGDEHKQAPANLDGGLADHEKLNVCFVLPNLQIKSPIETKFVGILPDTDPRVTEIAKRSNAVRILVNGFFDRRGSKCHVSVMVVHKDAPKTVLNDVALVSFRNCFAISCVLKSWAFSIGSPNSIGTRFSDYFDFYPFSPTRDGANLLHMGYALNTIESPNGFQGQTYPELPAIDKNFHLHTTHDEEIFDLLRKAWVERFEKGRKTWRANKLFRSLAIAYHACSLPKKNSLWFYDFGVSVALWISAFEILAHPGPSGKSDLTTVLDLLSKIRFSGSTTKRRRRFRFRGRVQNGNAAEYLYWRLYDSRNAFLHGNPATVHTALYKSRKRHSLLTSVAPVLYALALLCHFHWLNTPSKVKHVGGVGSFLQIYSKRYFTKSRLEKALKHILTGEDRRLM